MTRLPDSYFAALYASAGDPWDLEGRWYERRKRAITLAALPAPRVRHTFEPGCSVGLLTELLAERSDRVTATDVSESALATARRRVAAAGHEASVTFQRRSLDDPWPGDSVDLVVLSEVGYYLDRTTLAATLARECPRLPDDALVLAVHWRHPVPDYPLAGDEVHEILRSAPGMTVLAGYRDEDFALDVFGRGPQPWVAGRTGVPGA